MLRTLLLASALTLLALPAQAQPADPPPAADRAAVTADLPADFRLTAPYPNPFNPTTTLSLTVEQGQDVRVEVYNLLGQPVQRLYEGALEADETRTFTFEAGDLPSGIYLFRIEGETFVAARQVTLLK